MIAAFNNHDLIVKLLLDKGSEINRINEYGANALFYAIAKRNNEVAKTLLENGAEGNISASYNSYNNITPLALASTLGSTDIISSLLIGKARRKNRFNLGCDIFKKRIGFNSYKCKSGYKLFR